MRQINDPDNRNDTSTYPPALVDMANDPQHFGRMNDPVSSAYVKGPCGDDMEFYLVIEDNVITDIRFFTSGCIASRVCGSVTASLAIGQSAHQALGISAGKVINLLKGLPEDHRHCSILAVSTLYKAIADYLLKK